MTVYKGEHDGVRSNKCPLCGGELTYTGEDSIEDSSIEREWTCSQCGTEGVARYEVAFIGHAVGEK